MADNNSSSSTAIVAIVVLAIAAAFLFFITINGGVAGTGKKSVEIGVKLPHQTAPQLEPKEGSDGNATEANR